MIIDVVIIMKMTRIIITIIHAVSEVYSHVRSSDGLPWFVPQLFKSVQTCVCFLFSGHFSGRHPPVSPVHCQFGVHVGADVQACASAGLF